MAESECWVAQGDWDPLSRSACSLDGAWALVVPTRSGLLLAATTRVFEGERNLGAQGLLPVSQRQVPQRLGHAAHSRATSWLPGSE